MTDLYIKTPTQADYDALMRLAEAAGYEWYSKHKPTNLNCYTNHSERSVVKLLDDRKLLISSVERFELEGRKIETIPNLADIGAICKVQPKDLQVFSDENLNTSDVIKDWALNDGVIILLANGSYDLGFEEVYKALAVEYKPQGSEEVMTDVRFIDPKRKWRLKNENTEYSYIDFYTRNLKLMWGLYNGSVDLNGMTETEFKTSLASSKCPFVFEDFEAEEV